MFDPFGGGGGSRSSSNFFGNMSDMFFPRSPQHQQQQYQRESRPYSDVSERSAPPASRHACQALPTVKVTAEDLADEMNATCCVCIDDFVLGEEATRLPCGHLFHAPCVLDWLQRHCTCPVCRYELQTDDLTFEVGRAARMAQQRPRFRMAALERKTVHELRRLAGTLGVNVRGCLEKTDLVERMVQSGMVEIVDRPTGEAAGAAESPPSSNTPQRRPPASPSSANSPQRRTPAAAASSSSRRRTVVTAKDLRGMSVSTLRQLMRQHAVSTEGCLEKSDMILAIQRSAAIDVVEPVRMTLSELNGLSVSALRSLMRETRVSTEGCLEKSDMIQRLLGSGGFVLVVEPAGAAAASPMDWTPTGAQDRPINVNF